MAANLALMVEMVADAQKRRLEIMSAPLVTLSPDERKYREQQKKWLFDWSKKNHINYDAAFAQGAAP